MLSRLIACVRKFVTGIARAAARVLGWWHRKAWPGHRNRVAADPAYAAAAATILAGMLGLIPAREVLAAVLTAVVGVLLRGRTGAGDAGQGRPDGWEWA